MVAASKKNGEIRICIDPMHLNKALLRPHHPMKTIEEVIAEIPDAKVFTTLDAKNGFWQIMLDDESSLLTTFITTWGRYRFLRMPYGITPGSEVFQQAMEHEFAGTPCHIVVDDILVWGKDMKEHDQKLKKVLKRAKKIGLVLNPQKCKFRVTEVTYVGHKLTSEGVKPDPQKTMAIDKMEAPKDLQGLQRLLGMVNYLNKFIPKYSDITAPLRTLLHKDAAWCWLKPQEEAFEKLKKAITSPPVLQYYDVKKSVTLTGDSSKDGLGAACLQEGRPVAYASRALTNAETHYAQIEKELLAVLFACTRFYDYVYGRKVTVETDHQPLITIFKKSLKSAPARLQKFLMALQKFDIELVYKKGKELYIADTLSRAYLPGDVEPEYDDFEVMTVQAVTPSKLQEMKDATTNDEVLQQVTSTIQNGWPQHYKSVPSDARPFNNIRG